MYTLEIYIKIEIIMKSRNMNWKWYYIRRNKSSYLLLWFILALSILIWSYNEYFEGQKTFRFWFGSEILAIDWDWVQIFPVWSKIPLGEKSEKFEWNFIQVWASFISQRKPKTKTKTEIKERGQTHISRV